MIPIKVRFAKEIGTRISLRIYWGEGCPRMGCHNARFKLQDILHPLVLGTRTHVGGNPSDYPQEMWPKFCNDCGLPVPETGITKQVFNARLYDTEDGTVDKPGVMYYAHWIPLNHEWSNKTDYNLIAVCPDGYPWNIDSRASNCTMKDDKLHRCWCRHGNPEIGDIHVDKNGLTCRAGAGSIQTPKWHGFLHHGHFKL